MEGGIAQRQHTVFAQSVRIKLASPQAAKLIVHFFQGNQQCCTSMWDLIMDTPLIDGERDTEKEREETTPSIRRDSNPQTLCHDACAAARGKLASHPADLGSILVIIFDVAEVRGKWTVA